MSSSTQKSWQLQSENGFSLLEVIASLGFMAVISTIAVNSLKDLDDPVKNTTSEMIGYFKQVRARAISTTSAYTVSASDSGTVQSAFAKNCSDSNPVVDGRLTLHLPPGVALGDTSWEICFDGRGLPDTNIQIPIVGDSASRTLEVYLGGAVREIS